MDGWAINKRATIRTEKTKLYDFTGGISSNVGTSLNQFSRLDGPASLRNIDQPEELRHDPHKAASGHTDPQGLSKYHL